MGKTLGIWCNMQVYGDLPWVSDVICLCVETCLTYRIKYAKVRTCNTGLGYLMIIAIVWRLALSIWWNMQLYMESGLRFLMKYTSVWRVALGIWWFMQVYGIPAWSMIYIWWSMQVYARLALSIWLSMQLWRLALSFWWSMKVYVRLASCIWHAYYS